MSRLVMAEATIGSLKQQVTELSSSETLARMRESYSSAMAQAQDKHRHELARAAEETQKTREALEEKVRGGRCVCVFVCMCVCV